MTKKTLNQNGKYVQELIDTIEPNFIFENKLYSLKNKKEIFFKLMLKLTKFHFSSCKSYKKILDGFNFNFKNIRNLNDLPYLPITGASCSPFGKSLWKHHIKYAT